MSMELRVEAGAGRAHPNYVGIWVLLVGLMITGVAVSYLPIGRSAAVFLIFLVATIKAAVVALYYMHLRFERGVIYAMALVPIVLVVILTLLLFPDFVYHQH